MAKINTSLLRRVKVVSEKDSSGGKYLLPGLVRYDIRNHRSEVDHPWTFFCFPYFALGDFAEPRKESVKRVSNLKKIVQTLFGSLEASQSASSPPMDRPAAEQRNLHPVRKLLQARYRLDSTQVRDQGQSILGLTKAQVRRCLQIPGSPSFTSQDEDGMWKYPLHVPQLWGLSTSGGESVVFTAVICTIYLPEKDKLITLGPISESGLRGHLIELSPTKLQREHSPIIVRINVAFQFKLGRQQFLFAASQCDWWFVSMKDCHSK